MLLTTNNLTMMRQYHKLILLVWGVSICIWLFVSFGTSDPYQDVQQMLAIAKARNSVHQTPQSVPKSQEPPTDLSRPKASINTGDEFDHPRLYSRPQPGEITGSSPNFDNVPLGSYQPPIDDGSHISPVEIDEYVTSIWDLRDGRFWRLHCPSEEVFPVRYEILQRLATEHHSSKIKYYFALDLYEVRKILPRLMSTLVQVIRQLGPEKCAISIVEGRSSDGTYAILSALKDKMHEELPHTPFYLTQSDINPHGDGVDRIGALSALRNMALQPLVKDAKLYNNETITMFINDIAICTEDIYELLFNHVYQDATMTCAMDWIQGGHLFYDSWVSRSMVSPHLISHILIITSIQLATYPLPKQSLSFFILSSPSSSFISPIASRTYVPCLISKC